MEREVTVLVTVEVLGGGGVDVPLRNIGEEGIAKPGGGSRAPRTPPKRLRRSGFAAGYGPQLKNETPLFGELSRTSRDLVQL